MAKTYEPISTTTLSSTASTIDFTSIPSTYTDIRVVITVTGNSTGQGLLCRANGDTGTNYSAISLYGDGGASGAGVENNQAFWRVSTGAYLHDSYPSLITFDIFSYAGSLNKAGIATTSSYPGDGAVARSVQLWRSTSAINSLSFYLSSGTLKVGTIATLWGIKAA